MPKSKLQSNRAQSKKKTIRKKKPGSGVCRIKQNLFAFEIED